MSRSKALLAALSIALLCACASQAPRAVYWDRYSAHDETSRLVIDQSVWNDFLKRYVHTGSDGSARLAYAQITTADRDRLGAYLRQMQQVPISKYSLREQHAYWLNLYNAAVISLLLEHYPIDSPRSLMGGGMFSHSAFAEPRLQIEAQPLSLDDIENRILRPIWHDPRTEYALCKGTLGGPALAAQAFSSEYLGEQLDARAHAFVNSPKAFQVQSGRLRVSELYQQYADDFGGGDDAILSQLRLYADQTHQQVLNAIKHIDGYYFNWALNDSN